MYAKDILAQVQLLIACREGNCIVTVQ